MNIRDITKQIRVFADQLESQNALEAEKADPYAALKKAHAEGKVIEIFVKDDEYGPDRWSKKESDGWPLPPERYRIKPEPTFQLPPPPPGMQWHRTDGWQEGDLPQGWRPLVKGEESGLDCLQKYNGEWVNLADAVVAGPFEDCLRTRRPLTFTHAGKTWTWHRPGDPMPCDGEQMVFILTSECGASEQDYKASTYAWRVTKNKWWGAIIGWCYADEKKTVPLGPEDVPPGSVFRLIDPVGRTSWLSCAFVMEESAELLQSRSTFNVTFRKLLEEWQINRSLSKGQWNPNAWEPCSKEVDA